ncbi:MAG TPA: NUDIX domain-containing protein [Patescibacteria group bacterium]|nr:NUDIX domain-containing protein [Patescibacteria group bacterium]
MADYNKVGLLVLNESKDKFLVCVPGNYASRKKFNGYLFPGGKFHNGEDDLACLKREIWEELGCGLVEESIEFIEEFEDAAGTDPSKTVSIRLYKAGLQGEPKPHSEIGELVWLGKESVNEPRMTPIARNKIIPYLVANGILK